MKKIPPLKPGQYHWVEHGIYARRSRRGIVFGISYQYQGKRRLEVVGRYLSMARKALAVRQAEIAQGRFDLASTTRRPRFAAFLERYLREYSKPNKRAWDRDEMMAKHFVRFMGSLRLDEVSAWQVTRYRAARVAAGARPATVNRELSLLKHVMTMAVRWKELAENPLLEVKLARLEERPFRVLSRDEEVRLLACCAPHLRPIVVLALNTGLRRGELLALDWRDVDLVGGILTVRRSKSGKVRSVPLNAAARRSLSELDGREGAAFRYGGEPIGTIAAAFRNAVRRSGLPHVRFHDLRHTFITRLVLAGVDLATVRELAGHASFAMTIRYSHPSPEHRREAVQRLDAGATALGSGTV